MSTKNRSKKSSKSKSEVKVSTKVSEAAKLILKLITTKPGHYSKKRIREKLADRFDIHTIVAARKSLYKAHKLHTVKGKLQPTD